jgi:2-amino-4-hydroxy-6-hydroxymethyldihydropteridine diphosphokinase
VSTLALIGLGSNVGDRKATLEAATALLRDSPGIAVRAVSSFHETAPAGGPAGQGKYLNAALALETSEDAASILGRLREIEARLGRVRTVRWGERTLDLDLLLFGNSIIDTPDLTVPHLRMAVRRFVLAPLAAIAPEAVDPLTRRTVADLLANLDRRPGVIALASSARDPRIHDSLDRALRDDRWIVTDFRANEGLPEPRPTFAVVTGAEADESLIAWAGKHHPSYSIGREVPILRVRTPASQGPNDPAWRERVVAEVLAACASSRA